MSGDDPETSFHFQAVQQPRWTRAESLGDAANLVLEGKAYKGTRTGLVVERLVGLYQDRYAYQRGLCNRHPRAACKLAPSPLDHTTVASCRCTTYHDPVSKADARTWLLDRNCVVKPPTAGELAPKQRGVRPKGKWAITAAVQGVDTYIDLVRGCRRRGRGIIWVVAGGATATAFEGGAVAAAAKVRKAGRVRQANQSTMPPSPHLAQPNLITWPTCMSGRSSIAQWPRAVPLLWCPLPISIPPALCTAAPSRPYPHAPPAARPSPHFPSLPVCIPTHARYPLSSSAFTPSP